MHRLKTGALIRVCVTAPARLAEISDTTRDALVAYGEAVGLAFQIHDDILDVVGTESQTGKNAQSDAARDKPNFPSIIGLDESKREAERWCQEALMALESCEFDTRQLAWLATYVIGRNH
jgi:geranylgeranyl pyrophosphate synthase